MKISTVIVSSVLLPAALLLAGCAGEIAVSAVSAGERSSYNRVITSRDGMSAATINTLGNYLLQDKLDQDPDEVVRALETLYHNEPDPAFLNALADVALQQGRRFSPSDPDRAAGYHLASIYYSYCYLAVLDRPQDHFSVDRMMMVRCYNLALTELYAYLHQRALNEKSSFELSMPTGRRVNFDKPVYQLPLSRDMVADYLLCADYRTENLTHDSRQFGFGVPLIGKLRDKRPEDFDRFVTGQTIPLTLTLNFRVSEVKLDLLQLDARLNYIDSRNHDTVDFGGHLFPLAWDFSTPLAYMVKDPQPVNLLFYTARPDETRQYQGLYRFEPGDDRRIPVVFVHGLMSNARTWIQMINTLYNDPVIRANYQFLGFTYSSGNPILASAEQLRRELENERRRLIEAGKSVEKFDRMVLVGHSMGGLLSRLAISDSGDKVLAHLGGRENFTTLLEELPPEDRQTVRNIVEFKPLPFVRRAVFIAVPHRGSDMADSWYSRIGSALVRLPGNIIRRQVLMLKYLASIGSWTDSDRYHPFTGIDNLAPNNIALQVIDEVSMSPQIPIHSLIGNREAAGVPGGSDGIVPYASSHLDEAVSELVVKSGHAVQRNPLAIQELRRILLLHLNENNPGPEPAAANQPADFPGGEQ